ncbi:MAG TPA: hypothetical protein VFU65_04875 [Actinocrinis sp.]|nr:hypothetical protein [Actinocrinis sp.]
MDFDFPRGPRLNPADLATNIHVTNILAYQGSAKFWQPIQALVTSYLRLRAAQIRERSDTLNLLVGAIASWRANQSENWWLSDLDKKKEVALVGFERMMSRESADVGGHPAADGPDSRPSKPTTTASVPQSIQPATAPMGISVHGAKGGTSSFNAALAHTPEITEIGLPGGVMNYDVSPLGDQAKCLAFISPGGLLYTHDGLHPIDSAGKPIRYVLVLGSEGEPVLYISQHVAAAAEGQTGFSDHEYPILESHAQIEGQVIGAGDMIVNVGQIEFVSNQSGTWRPRGRNLAHTLKFLVRIRLLKETDIAQGKVTVGQFIGQPDGYNVDEGELVMLVGRVMTGKLIPKT